MLYKKLGNTGLDVSVAGLGCGGNSRLGLKYGSTESEAVALVLEAINLGVNFIDTAEAYGTEAVVGAAAKQSGRQDLVISTKSRIRQASRVLSAVEVIDNLHGSLRRLQTDYIDVFHLHMITPDIYSHAHDHILPALLKEQEKGTIRHIGITESGPRDPQQETLSAAMQAPDFPWEVVMFAFHMLNQGARQRILKHTQVKGIGALLMFVVRNIFSQPDRLKQVLKELAKKDSSLIEMADLEQPLDFLLHEAGATNITEAAYRYARHEPGADVILFGTGNVDHLRANVASILKPALPESDSERLESLFGHLIGVGLDSPGSLTRK